MGQGYGDEDISACIAEKTPKIAKSYSCRLTIPDKYAE